MSVFLVIEGRPVGKGRPRFVRATGRTYTPPETVSFEERVRAAWVSAGRPRLGDGPLGARIWVAHARPKGHYLVDGGLSAAGLRCPHPIRKPDLDNVAKGLTDALSGLAYRDDAQFVDVHARRRWAVPGEIEYVSLEMWALDGPPRLRELPRAGRREAA